MGHQEAPGVDGPLNIVGPTISGETRFQELGRKGLTIVVSAIVVIRRDDVVLCVIYPIHRIALRQQKIAYLF